MTEIRVLAAGGDGFPSDIPVEGDGGSGGGGNSGSSSPGGDNNDNTSDSGVAPKAQAIFRNSNMTEQNWNVIENMLEKIIENCMGQNLYNGLVEKLNGSTLSIQFVNTDYSSFHFVNGTSGIKLSSQNVESNHLIHEMFHAFQAYRELICKCTNEFGDRSALCTIYLSKESSGIPWK